MKVTHFPTCPSTQTYLKENLETYLAHGEEEILIGTSLQTQGVGRHQSEWHSTQEALAFSFSLRPCTKMTLSSLEMGVLLAHFFQTTWQVPLGLKWPNDLMNARGEKCGGILVHCHSPDWIIVGIGINLVQGAQENLPQGFKVPPGFVFLEHERPQDLPPEFSQTLPREIYRYILAHRKNPGEIVKDWNDLCLHQNKQVTHTEGKISHQGIFAGLGPDGEAQILDGESRKILRFYSGSLNF